MIAPSDDAFIAAIGNLGLSAAAVLADTDLLKTLINLHLVAVPSLNATTGSTLGGDELELFVDDSPATLEEFITSEIGVVFPSVALVGGAEVATADQVVQCPGGGAVAAFVDTVLLPPTTATAPAAAPGPAPAETPISTTIGGLVGLACSGITDVLATDNFSILYGLLTRPDVANTKIVIPPGEIVIAAPTNAAFTSLLGKLDPKLAENTTVVVDLLANHIAVASSATTTDPAVALSGAPMNFWKAPAGADPTPVSIDTLIADETRTGAITDGDNDIAKVAAAVSCASEGQYAFAIDKVLVPAAYEAALTPAAAPGSAPALAPAASSAKTVTFGLAAAVAMAVAVFV